jgi:hypothetical protein
MNPFAILVVALLKQNKTKKAHQNTFDRLDYNTKK